MTTIQEAKDYLKRNYEEGVNCPCCDQLVKLYRRKFNKIMARGLISLVRAYGQSGGKPVHVHDIPLDDRDVRSMGGSFALLRHWSLIKPEQAESAYKRLSGLWRPTQAGIDFVHRKTEVPEYLNMYNNKVISISTSQIGIVKALGTEFDYKQMMGEMYIRPDIVTNKLKWLKDERQEIEQEKLLDLPPAVTPRRYV